MDRPAPLRCTDPEVAALARALLEHGEGSPEYKAALSKCVRRLSDWIDDQVARQVYGQLSRELTPATNAVDPSAQPSGTP